MMRKGIIKKVRRLVIKIGSSVLAGGGEGGQTHLTHAEGIMPKVFDHLAQEVHLARQRGKEITIVSSGAIALGIKKLVLKKRPSTIPERQAVAAVGQVELMARYERAFSACGEKVAQALLTRDDFSDRKRFLNARNTVTTLLSMGIIPVINENDTVAVDELKFGDNDALSALTVSLVEADLLIMLSDIDGIYDNDPKTEPSAKKIKVVSDIDSLSADDIVMAPTKSYYGTGGMMSKISAAKTAAHYGCSTVVARGTGANVITRILDGEEEGTLILPRESKLTGKQHWLVYSARPCGKVFIDDGARAALTEKGKSLLPSGVLRVEGTFEAGDAIDCVDAKGKAFARGLANYGSSEINMIKGLKTGQIENALGYRAYDEIIHRDNFVIK